MKFFTKLFSKKPEIKPKTNIEIGDIVVVHNYHIGEFLETWNGEVGIVNRIDPEIIWIKTHPECICSGFKEENLLILRSGCFNYKTPLEHILKLLDGGNWRETTEEMLNRQQFEKTTIFSDGTGI